jgi:hypothetical protein
MQKLELYSLLLNALFLIGVLEELGFKVTKPVTVYEDNNAAVIMANQEIGPNKKVKHFIMLVEYCRQQVYLGLINIEHIDTEENIADILTKNIYNTKRFTKHRDSLLGINSTTSINQINTNKITTESSESNDKINTESCESNSNNEQ